MHLLTEQDLRFLRLKREKFAPQYADLGAHYFAREFICVPSEYISLASEKGIYGYSFNRIGPHEVLDNGDVFCMWGRITGSVSGEVCRTKIEAVVGCLFPSGETIRDFLEDGNHWNAHPAIGNSVQRLHRLANGFIDTVPLAERSGSILYKFQDFLSRVPV